MKPGQPNLSAGGAPVLQGELFSDIPASAPPHSPERAALKSETSNLKSSPARLRKSASSPPLPEFDEAIHEVLDRELHSPPERADFKSEISNIKPSAECSEDSLPARMLNEFVYCPRLFFYEHVDGIFVHNADTERGKDIHTRVDKGTGALPAPPKEGEAPAASEGVLHSRSVSMGSSALGVVAKLDLVESSDGAVCPVDYKAGAPREDADSNSLWPTDRMQLGLQMLILRENGYVCDQGFIYYRATKQRVPLAWSEDLRAWLEERVAAARQLLRSRKRPDPLVDSPKCVRCSLAPVCLPDETRFLQSHEEDEAPAPPQLRRLMASSDDARALYLNTQGLRVGVKDRVLVMKEKDQTVEEIRLTDVHHLAVLGNIQISTQTIQRLCQQEIPLTWFSMGGWFYGITRGHSLTNVLLRRAQFRAAADPDACLRLARYFVAGKIRNARKMLMRNALVQPTDALLRLKHAASDALNASSIPSLLGIEGAAAALSFSEFSGMIKTDDDEIPGLADLESEISNLKSPSAFTFDFRKRNRRPPTDPVNALLSFAYSLLAKDCTVALLSVGFDPWMGFYHQPRPGRPALALDLMEEFRPLIAESAVLTAINNRMLTPTDFVSAGEAVNLSPEGRKRFLYAYEQRMGHLITHPVFDYKVSYRRALELQARILARVLEGEIPHYLPFLTR